MSEITLTPSQTVGSACKAFADAFGGLLRIKADAGATLASAGLRSDIKADDATTVAEFCEEAKSAGLTAKVRTADDWVAVIDAFPLGAIRRIGKNSNKAKMQNILDGLDQSPAAPVARKEEAPAAKPLPKKEQDLKPQQKTSDLISQDEMNELLKKMDEMLATIKKLEARIVALENSNGGGNAAATDSSNLKVSKFIVLYNNYKPTENGIGIFKESWLSEGWAEDYKSNPAKFAEFLRDGLLYEDRKLIETAYYVVLSNGEVHPYIPMSDENCLKIIRSFADQSGITYKAQTKADKIAQQIVSKYGSIGDTSVIIGQQIVTIHGGVCRIHDSVISSEQADKIVSDFLDKVDSVKEMIESKPEKLDVNAGMSAAYKLQAIRNYLDELKFVKPADVEPKVELERWFREYEAYKKRNLQS